MGDSKQVKVDNWGIFFLQRLQTFFNKTYFCDLTLQFDDNVQLKVHRLVMNACTEYFQVLEQTCEVINDCLIMPPDLQADVVVPIVNFMYTGILEFQTSIFDRLYATARLMNMTVLTKLLDAQKIPISPISKPMSKKMNSVTWNLQGKKIAPKTMDPDLPEPLPGRKLPIWKRKSVPNSVSYRTDFVGLPDPLSSKYVKSPVNESPKPTRFEWPDDEDTPFDTNSFDEISYTSKPIILPHREKSPKPSTSSNNFEALKRTSVGTKRSGSPIYIDSKRVNIQDVKEYIKEQKLRSDYIEYDDAEAADNDLQTFDNDNDTDEEKDENMDDAQNRSILKNEASSSHNKKVRFSIEEKENSAKKPQTVDMTNHTKIITEVLKKYPHLVKKNKNIKLKILAKGANINTGIKPMGLPVKPSKPVTATKVSYMVMKPGENSKTDTKNTKKDGHWSCHKCSNPNPLHFDTYYLYRKHLTDVHNEKTDSQMCNICGHTSRKQNLLMHHKLVKHNITPPPSYVFPKCKDCPFIAVSPAILVKHQVVHTNQGLSCAECNTLFTTKSALISHIQLTGHTDKNNCPTYDCTYCPKKFISDETLLQHIRNNHKEEARKEHLLSPVPEETTDKNVITAEEIDALEQKSEGVKIEKNVPVEKPKKRIKILSDVKVTAPPKKVQGIKIETQPETSQLEPSSEAESLSNVASGIAASLGLVNTIVVLDDNQFIIQDGGQENMIANPQNLIIPDNIQNLVTQHQVVTTDASSIISQATLDKNNIASTDELVMVLTDHDYSDAANNTVITTENSNIVVLYSHPVQSQDGQFIPQSGNIMINSDMSLVEVDGNYAVTNSASVEGKTCEESIELIQQEIDNHIEGDSQEQNKIVEETAADLTEDQTDNIEREVITSNEMLVEPEPEKMEVDPMQEPQITEYQEISENQQIEQVQINDNQQATQEQMIEYETNENQQTIDHQINENHAIMEQQGNENQQIIEHQENQQIIEHQENENQQIIEHQENQQIIEHQENANQQAIEHQEDHQIIEQKTNESQPEVNADQQIMEHEINENQQITEHQVNENQQSVVEINAGQETMEQEIIENQQIENEHSEDQQIIGSVQTNDNQEENRETVEIRKELIHAPEIHEAGYPTEEAETISAPENEEIPAEDNRFEEPMEIEESIEMIQEEINRSSDLQKIVQPEEISEDIPPSKCKENVSSEEIIEKVLPVTPEEIESQIEEHKGGSEQIPDILNEPTNKNQIGNQENKEEIEYMEVDSSKIAKTLENIEAANLPEEPDPGPVIETTLSREIELNTEDKLEKAENLRDEKEENIPSSIIQPDLEITSPQIEELPENTEENTVEPISESENSQPQETNETQAQTEDNLQDITEENLQSSITKGNLQDSTIEDSLQDSIADNSVDTSQEDISQEEIQLDLKPLEVKLPPKEVKTKHTLLKNEESPKNSKISKLLDDWDDADTDSQQSDTPKPSTIESTRVVRTLINDWEDEEEA